MTNETQKRCERFIENRDIIKEGFVWESSYLYPLCAAIYASKNKTADCVELRDCVGLLKQKVGPFSNFRGTAKLAIAAMLAVSGSPEATLDNSLTVYGLMKNEFFSSPYLSVAAVIVARLSSECAYEHVAQRTRNMYDLMKFGHPFLTSSEDSAFAALLALSPLGDEQLIGEAEKCYDILKYNFFVKNAVQSLSLILALCEKSAEDKCRLITNVLQALKEEGCSFGTNYELPTLGAFAASVRCPEDIAAAIIEIDGFLSEQKGFGAFGIGKKQRLMYAGILAQDDFINDAAVQTAAVSGTISMIAAQQAAICAAIAASSAASSAAAGGASAT